MRRVHFVGGNLVSTNLIGTDNDTFVPVSGEQFRYLSKKDPPEPIATGAFIAPNAEGRFVFFGGTWRRVPTWIAMAELLLIVWFLLQLWSANFSMTHPETGGGTAFAASASVS